MRKEMNQEGFAQSTASETETNDEMREEIGLEG